MTIRFQSQDMSILVLKLWVVIFLLSIRMSYVNYMSNCKITKNRRYLLALAIAVPLFIAYSPIVVWADSLRGTVQEDFMVGTENDDVMTGRHGDDNMYGNSGDDTMYGKQGDDIVVGDQGNDSIFGGSGNDFLVGQLGEDWLNGGPGDDLLRGGAAGIAGGPDTSPNHYDCGPGFDSIEDYDPVRGDTKTNDCEEY